MDNENQSNMHLHAKSKSRRLREKACKQKLFSMSAQAMEMHSLRSQMQELTFATQQLHCCLLQWFCQPHGTAPDGKEFEGTDENVQPESETIAESNVMDAHVELIDPSTALPTFCEGQVAAANTGSEVAMEIRHERYDDETKLQNEAIEAAVERYVVSQTTALRGKFAKRWPPIEGMSEDAAFDQISGLLVDGCRDVISGALEQPLTTDQESYLKDKVVVLSAAKFNEWKSFVTMNTGIQATNSIDLGASGPSQMKSVTKRGMAQPRSSGKNRKK